MEARVLTNEAANGTLTYEVMVQTDDGHGFVIAAKSQENAETFIAGLQDLMATHTTETLNVREG